VVFFLIAALAFCVIGFLASYEPPGFPEFSLLYSFIGVACLFGIAWVLFPRRSPRLALRFKQG
jgi:hypothetical protein